MAKDTRVTETDLQEPGSPGLADAHIRSEIYYWKSDRPAALNGRPRRRRERVDLAPLLLAELERAFPRRQVSLEPACGQGNHITFFARISGLNGFVRVEDGPEGRDCFELETRIIRIVGETGVPVPRVYAVDSSRSRVPFAWQVTERVPNPDLNRLQKTGDLNLPAVARKIGRFVARWQEIKPVGFGPFDPDASEDNSGLKGYHRNYSDYFRLHLDRHAAYLRDRGFLTEEKAKEIVRTIDAHCDLLDLERSCLVHKDLALWNILGTFDEISAFIDWEDAIGGDPTDDLSLLACFHPGTVISQALEGYVQVRDLPADYRRRFWLHLLRNMLVKAVIRIASGYFQQTDDLFLIESGATGSELEIFTRQRIDIALEGLKKNKPIIEL